MDQLTRFRAMHRDELDHIQSCPCHRSPAARQLHSSDRFQVPSVGCRAHEKESGLKLPQRKPRYQTPNTTLTPRPPQ